MESLASLCLAKLVELDLQEDCFVTPLLPEMLRDGYRMERRKKEVMAICGDRVTTRIIEEEETEYDWRFGRHVRGAIRVNEGKIRNAENILEAIRNSQRGVHYIGVFIFSFATTLPYCYMKQEEEFREWFIPSYENAREKYTFSGSFKNNYLEAVSVEESTKRIASFTYPS